MKPQQPYDICIAGGGVAGAALAAYLGTGNLRIAVIEKTLAEQDRIIGELLQPGGVEMLAKMGLQEVLEGFDAQLIEGYGLFLNGENFKVNYPAQGGQPLTGRGLRNGKFLQKIRQVAFTRPNVTVIEGTVTALTEEQGTVTGVAYKPRGAEAAENLQATLTVISDGIFSTLRNGLTGADKKVSGHFLGLVLKDCPLPYANHGHVIITALSPVLVYPISSRETRMLIDFAGTEPPKKGEELTTYLLNEIGTRLPAVMLPAFTAAVNEGKFKVMPNHLMAARPVLKNGAVLLGDSLNMRHPLTGGGMTVAFSDVYLLGRQLLALPPAGNKAQVYAAVKAFYSARSKQSSSINILADALYGVMRNDDLKQACFSYLKRGGSYSQQPVSILSAVSRDVRLLIRHFFAVAVYGTRQVLLPRPTPNRLKRSYRMLADAVNIITPLLKNERILRW